MAEYNTSAEYNCDETSDFEGYNNEDIGENESLGPDSNPDSLIIELVLVGSSGVSSDYTDFGYKQVDNGPNTINNATVTANENIPNRTTNFTDITSMSFTQDIGASLPGNIDVSVATALDNFNLHFKPEYLVTQGNTQTTMPSSNKINSERQIIMAMLIVCGRKPQFNN